MTRTEQYALRAYGPILVAIIAVAQFSELRTDLVMRWLAGIFPGVFA